MTLKTSFVAFLLGLVGGYLALAAGPIAAALVVLAFVLLLRSVRGGSSEAGAFMLGAGISGALVLGRLLLLESKCDYMPCTSPLTFPTFVVYVATGIVGLTVLAWSIARTRAKSRQTKTPS